jgi:predicted transcriptional regulator
MQNETNGPDFAELTAGIVAAYVERTKVGVDELPGLISSVHSALKGLGQAPAAVEPPTPAVPVKKSVTPDHLISLEDGRRYKSLKRHLTGLGMTPDEYRQKWGLPPTYPMVAANYAKARSELAKKIGLGRKRAEPAPAPAARGRKRAAAKA